MAKTDPELYFRSFGLAVTRDSLGTHRICWQPFSSDIWFPKVSLPPTARHLAGGMSEK